MMLFSLPCCLLLSLYASHVLGLAALASVFQQVRLLAPSSGSFGDGDTQTLEHPTSFDVSMQDEANSTALFPVPQCHGVTIEEATIDQLSLIHI